MREGVCEGGRERYEKGMEGLWGRGVSLMK